MEITELRDLSVDELQARLEDLREELFNLKFQNSTGQLENPMRLRVVRKDIARAMTVLNELEAA